MIVIRNVFQLKFGKAREALAVMKEGIAIQKRLVAGRFCTSSDRCHRPALHARLGIDGVQPRYFRSRSAPDLRRQGLSGELSKDGSASGVWTPRDFYHR